MKTWVRCWALKVCDFKLVVSGRPPKMKNFSDPPETTQSPRRKRDVTVAQNLGRRSSLNEGILVKFFGCQCVYGSKC